MNPPEPNLQNSLLCAAVGTIIYILILLLTTS